jgi:hypothetical protein
MNAELPSTMPRSAAHGFCRASAKAHFVTLCVLLFAFVVDYAFGAFHSMTEIPTAAAEDEALGNETSARSDYRKSWWEESWNPRIDSRVVGCPASSMSSVNFVPTSPRYTEDTDNICNMADPTTRTGLASTVPAPDPAVPTNDLLLIGGYGDLRQRHKETFCAAEVRFAKDFFGLHPYADLACVNGGTRYARLGLLYVFKMPHKLRLTVGSGPGYYHHERGCTNLGYSVEFHSWLEVSGIVLGRRVGLSVGHISNAHLAPYNPGSEDVSLSVVASSW